MKKAPSGIGEALAVETSVVTTGHSRTTRRWRSSWWSGGVARSLPYRIGTRGEGWSQRATPWRKARRGACWHGWM